LSTSPVRGAAVRLGIVLLAAIGGGVFVGVRQGQKQGDAGSGATRSDQPAEAPLRSSEDETRGQSAKQVFAHSCGTCHTLRAAGVTGGIGPELDSPERKLTVRLVRDQIRTGSLDSSMPANLLTGGTADRVAAYVARVSRQNR